MTPDAAGTVYVNGRLLPAAEASLSPLDRGFTLADGLFETVVADGQRVFRLPDHLRRLAAGAEVLGLTLPTEETLAAAILQTLRANELALAIARLTVSRGVGLGRGLDVSAGLEPTVVVTVSRWGGLPDEVPAGRSLALANARRNDTSPLAGVKSLSYVDAVVARMMAKRAGADDALVCNTGGRVTGATSSNLFIVMEGGLVTPPLSDGVLPGVARRTVLEEAARLGLETRERSLSPGDVAGSEEAFLTNVVTGVVPVTALDGRSVGSGAAGRVTSRLFSAYRDRVRRELL